MAFIPSAKHPKRQQRRNLKFVKKHPQSWMGAIYGVKQKPQKPEVKAAPYKTPPHLDHGMDLSAANKPLPGYNPFSGKGPTGYDIGRRHQQTPHTMGGGGFDESKHPRVPSGRGGGQFRSKR